MTDIALILAAGGSRRLAQPKQLVVVDGEALVSRAVQAARDAGLEPVVVTGCRADDVEAVVDAEVVFNDDWPRGMGTSIAVGVRAVLDRATSITVMTCDQHAVRAADLRRLHEVSRECDIVASEYEGATGVPARFAPACFDDLARLEGDVGARNLIRNGQFRVVSVSIEHAKLDVDDPADLEGLA